MSERIFWRTPDRRIDIAVVLFLAILVAFEIILISQPNFFQGKSQLSLQNSYEGYAENIVARCAAATYRPACYDKEIPKLMSAISMENAFRVTKIIQDKDPSYQYCHVLGHTLSTQEVAKDPARWKEIIPRCPSGLCSNGCIHGAFQERFRTESLSDTQIAAIKSDLEAICEKKSDWDPTGLEQASCYHALGHLTMYLTSANINKSIKLCEEIAVKSDGRDYSQLCFDGTFMQIFQPLEPEDFALVKGKEVAKEELASFCGNFTGKKKGSCWSEGWPLFREELQKPEGLLKYCGAAEPQEQGRCYTALVYVLTAQFNFDLKKVMDYCSGLPPNIAGRCFADAASRLIETDYRNIDKAVTLCAAASSVEQRNECFQELLKFSTYNFHAGSADFVHLCNRLPGKFSDHCLSQSVVPRTE